MTHNVGIESVAVVGVGRIGLPIVANLVRAGHRVYACDVRAEVTAEVHAAGAVWSDNAVEAVGRADVLLTVLPGSPELRDVMLGAGNSPGLLHELRTSTDWLDLTSASPELGAALATTAQRRGIGHLDCAVGGGAPAARRGELTLYIGGEESVLQRRRALLSTIADPQRLLHMGGHGMGYLTKLLVNVLWFGQAVATAEVLLLGQAAGLEPTELGEVLAEGPASSEFIRSYLPALFAGDYLPNFGLDRCVEELNSMQRFAASLATPFELSSLVADIHRAALDRFGAVDGELLAVAHLERLAGRTLRADG